LCFFMNASLMNASLDLRSKIWAEIGSPGEASGD